MTFSDRLAKPVPAGNRLIAALPPKERVHLLARCDEVDLAFSETLVEAGERLRHVYFPTDGSYISLVMPAAGASGLEVGLVGNEGMFGASLMLGIDISPLRALVQGSGPALRLSAAAFRKEVLASVALRKKLNSYLFVQMTQFAQSAACMRFHLLEARLARWLLMTQDRARTDRFQITHAFLALMLGVRRAGITDAAKALHARGLVNYKRGEVTVLNRRGLEGASCACYLADRELYRATLG